MLEARLSRMAVMPEKGALFFCGVAEYGEEMLNVKVKFDFENMDHKLFLEELRDTIAREFQIPVYHVVMNNDVVLGKMLAWHERFKALGLT